MGRNGRTGLAYTESGRSTKWPVKIHIGLLAVQSVLGDVDEQIELRYTSYGTPMGHDLQFYKDIPITSIPCGQAMAQLWLSQSICGPTCEAQVDAKFIF